MTFLAGPCLLSPQKSQAGNSTWPPIMPSQKQKALSSRIKKLLTQKILQNYVDHEVQICMLILEPLRNCPGHHGLHIRKVSPQRSHMYLPPNMMVAQWGAPWPQCARTQGWCSQECWVQRAMLTQHFCWSVHHGPHPGSETPIEGPETTTPVRQNPSQNRNKQQLFRNKRLSKLEHRIYSHFKYRELSTMWETSIAIF